MRSVLYGAGIAAAVVSAALSNETRFVASLTISTMLAHEPVGGPVRLRARQEGANRIGAVRAVGDLVVEILHVDDGGGDALRVAGRLQRIGRGYEGAVGDDDQLRGIRRGVPLRRLVENDLRRRLH